MCFDILKMLNVFTGQTDKPERKIGSDDGAEVR